MFFFWLYYTCYILYIFGIKIILGFTCLKLLVLGAGEEWGSESSFSFHVHLLSLSLCSGLFILPGLQRQADSNSCHFTRWSETTIIYSMVTSWLVCSSPDCSIRVRALVGEIVLCSWAKHITFTLPLSTQVYI